MFSLFLWLLLMTAATTEAWAALAPAPGGTNPVMTATYSGTGGAAPTFSVDEAAGGVSAMDTNGAAITPAVSAADMVVTTQFDTE